VAQLSSATGPASEPKGLSVNDECIFQMCNQSEGNSVEVINIAENRPFATLKTVVNAAQNVLDCLLFGIISYFDLRRSGFTGIGTLNGLHIHLLRFTGKASGTQYLECATSK
jgi:hypothetical protein